MKKHTASLLITGALLISSAAAQDSNPQPKPQPAGSIFADDPFGFRNTDEYKSLPKAEGEEHLRQFYDALIKSSMQLFPAPTQVTPAPAKPPTAPSKPCVPPKKHAWFVIPPAVQKQLNKEAAEIAKKTGVVLDPTAPQQAINQAEQPKPCVVPPSPTKQ